MQQMTHPNKLAAMYMDIAQRLAELTQDLQFLESEITPATNPADHLEGAIKPMQQAFGRLWDLARREVDFDPTGEEDPPESAVAYAKAAAKRSPTPEEGPFRRAEKLDLGKWRDFSVETACAGGTLCKRIPERTVPALARPGMITQPSEGIKGSGCAVIVHTTPEFCIVRSEAGETVAMSWGEVSIEHVGPDPAYLARSPMEVLVAPKQDGGGDR